MELLQQFQGVLGSLLLGGCFCFVYNLLRVLFNHKFLVVVWIPLQVIYCLFSSYLYYLFLCVFTYGIYNFFFTISLISGMLIYGKFYYPKLKIIFDRIGNKIDFEISKIKLKKHKKRQKDVIENK